MSDLRYKLHGFYMACFDLYMVYSSLFESLARIATGEADDVDWMIFWYGVSLFSGALCIFSIYAAACLISGDAP